MSGARHSRVAASTVRATLFLAALVAAACARRPLPRTDETRLCRCTPTQPCWPAPADWQRLETVLSTKLEIPRSLVAPCLRDPSSAACANAIRTSSNPFSLQDQPAGTQSSGWLGAWTAAPSTYAVVAQNTPDVVAAVKFAREHRLRLVVKGTGHDYLGRSNAPDSLLLWTHNMRQVSPHDAFVGRGCAAAQTGVPAVSVRAGG